jgi:hypothetical protein
MCKIGRISANRGSWSSVMLGIEPVTAKRDILKETQAHPSANGAIVQQV